MTKKLSPMGRLARIREIIENVDNRAMAADGPVTPTLQEMTQAEMSEIYKLTDIKSLLPQPGDDKLLRDAFGAFGL